MPSLKGVGPLSARQLAMRLLAGPYAKGWNWDPVIATGDSPRSEVLMLAENSWLIRL